MKFAFYIAAAVMIIVALCLLVQPLLRANPRQKKPQVLFAIALIVVALPGAAIYLYTLLGTPAALNETYLRDAPSIVEASNVPGNSRQQDIEKWMNTAHVYDMEQRGVDARDAYGNVLKIDAKNTAAMIGWVEADMTQQADYAIDAASRQLLEQAIALEPTNQRALWLWGISEFQRQDYAEASATWKRLQQLLAPGSKMMQPVAQQIVIAEAKEKMKTTSAALVQ